jgi:hypothetical protein
VKEFLVRSGDNKDDDFVHGATASAISVTVFMWEYMQNHLEKENSLLVTVGLKVKHKLKPILLKCSSMINASLSYV